MKRLSLPAEVLAALVTIIGTLMVGIILGVLEGKIGFISVLGFVAFLVLCLVLYLLYKRSGPRVTAGAGLVMLVIGFVVFAVFFRKPGGAADAALTGTPTLAPTSAQVTQSTNTPQPPAPTQPAPHPTAAPTQPDPQPTVAPILPPATTPIPTLAATRLPTATPRPAQTAALGESVEVLTTIVAEFFAPGPKPAALAVSDDALWVGDADQKLVYKLDKSGVPQGTFQVTPKGTIQAMAWDGEALRVAVGEYSGGQIARIDATGGVVESFPIPFQTTGLGWDAATSTLWAVASQADSYLLQYSADGRLLRILTVGAFGSVDAMTWAPDGFWAVSVFGDWLRYDLSGTLLRDDELPMEVFGSEMGIARDADGSVWLAVATLKKIYRFATRTEKMGLVPTSTPNTGGPGQSGIPGALALPHPDLEEMPGSKATVIVTNSLGGPMTLSFDYSNKHETAILQPGETWTAYLEPNSYSVFFSANAPKPVAYAGKMLMLRGYQYTWDVRPPQ